MVAISVLMKKRTNGRTDGQPENMMLSPTLLTGVGIKSNIRGPTDFTEKLLSCKI